MSFTPLTNLSQDLGDGNGIIRLWSKANYVETKWSTDGEFGKDIYAYFFVPDGFVQSGSETFQFNFPFKYVYDQIWVGDKISDFFWHLESDGHKTSTLYTDQKTKLPFVVVPHVGEPSYPGEKRFFIPVSTNY